MEREIENFVRESLAFWEGAFFAVPEDAPDGAWFQMHVDTAEHILNEWDSKTMLATELDVPEGMDATDLVLEYMSQADAAEGYID